MGIANTILLTCILDTPRNKPVAYTDIKYTFPVKYVTLIHQHNKKKIYNRKVYVMRYKQGITRMYRLVYSFNVFGLMYYIRYVNHVRNGKVYILRTLCTYTSYKRIHTCPRFVRYIIYAIVYS